jgi:hypothetical protein
LGIDKIATAGLRAANCQRQLAAPELPVAIPGADSELPNGSLVLKPQAWTLASNSGVGGAYAEQVIATVRGAKRRARRETTRNCLWQLRGLAIRKIAKRFCGPCVYGLC